MLTQELLRVFRTLRHVILHESAGLYCSVLRKLSFFLFFFGGRKDWTDGRRSSSGGGGVTVNERR